LKQIEKRKSDHIEIALEEQVGSGYRYWDDVKMTHCALPEVDMTEIDTSCRLFGKKLAFPLIVTAITGGYSKAEKINKNLAEACQELRIGMGVGSERAAVENGADASYTILKDYDVPLMIGNVGAPQLIKQDRKKAFTVDQVKQAMEMIDADVMAIHLNFLQEVAQPEGDTNAKGCLDAIRKVAREVPSIAKETGAGISRQVAMKLKGSGIVGMDISGTGGTSFSSVERFRAERAGNIRCAAIGRLFSDWGIPAPASVLEANVGLPIIASGGLEDGLQLAKALALGAKCGGIARGVLREATISSKAVEERLVLIREELRAAMFLTGSADVASLSSKDCIVTGKTAEWISQKDEEGL
jgi:isopentenyl-diphosphate delta-isomerase